MKTRYKILIVVGLAILYFCLVQRYGSPAVTASLSTAELQSTYQEFNEEYFTNSLPKDAVVDYSEHNPDFMATAVMMGDGRFHIAMNEIYVGGARTARLTELHEMCHIKTWHQEADEHGRLWRSCMLVLDAEGAFREQIIDGYREH